MASDAESSLSASVSQAFTMDGAREMLRLTAGAIQIEKQVDALEASVHENTSLSIDLAKALVETTCRTILKDRGITPSKRSPSLNELLTEALTALQLVNPYRDDEADVVKHLRRMAKGLVSAFQGLGELRNSQGFASHGPDGYMDALDPVQAMFAARAADALVHFLFQAHRSYGGPMAREGGQPTLRELEERREAVDYSAHTDFNEYIDEQHWPATILGLEFKASEILAKVDPEAYLSFLDEYEASPPDELLDSYSDKADECASPERQEE